MTFHSSRILSWNAHSLDELKSFTITQMLKEKSINFAGISETWKHFRGDVYDGGEGSDTVDYSDDTFGMTNHQTWHLPTKSVLEVLC